MTRLPKTARGLLARSVGGDSGIGREEEGGDEWGTERAGGTECLAAKFMASDANLLREEAAKNEVECT